MPYCDIEIFCFFEQLIARLSICRSGIFVILLTVSKKLILNGKILFEIQLVL